MNKYYSTEKNTEAMKRYRRTFLGTIQGKLQGSKRNAKAKGFKHELDAEFLKELWEKQRGLCALTGVKLGFIGSGWCAASIDRIDSNKGYTRNNVQWTCWRPNEAKSNMTNEDFINMCKAIAITNK